jgi:aerobic-type carbon monoxide dehydrogenase small subunit (CoxS/CutS family)
MADSLNIRVTVNGRVHEESVEPRLLLGDFLRDRLNISGTHFGCEQGVCGACTILLDGQSVRSCLMFAVQVDGCEIKTVESMADGDELHSLQASFKKNHALQCGYCTPGMLATAVDVLENHDVTSRKEISEEISGNICRCTGYVNIVTAIEEVANAKEGS